MFTYSDEDLEPPQFFHYSRSAHHMMKEIGYDLRRGEGLNLERDDAFLYNLSYRKESLLTITIRLAGGWSTLPYPLNLIRNLKSLYHHILQTHQIGNLT